MKFFENFLIDIWHFPIKIVFVIIHCSIRRLSVPPHLSHFSRADHQRLRSHDLLSMLVHIYGSRELFVSEYATLLGEKLLAVRDFNAEKEVSHIILIQNHMIALNYVSFACILETILKIISIIIYFLNCTHFPSNSI